MIGSVKLHRKGGGEGGGERRVREEGGERKEGDYKRQ